MDSAARAYKTSGPWAKVQCFATEFGTTFEEEYTRAVVVRDHRGRTAHFRERHATLRNCTIADELETLRGTASCGRETRPARRHGGHQDAVRRSAASGGSRVLRRCHVAGAHQCVHHVVPIAGSSCTIAGWRRHLFCSCS